VFAKEGRAARRQFWYAQKEAKRRSLLQTPASGEMDILYGLVGRIQSGTTAGAA